MKEPGRTRAYAQMCAGTHGPAEAKLPAAKASGVPVLVVMGTDDKDFPDPAVEANWVGRRLGATVELLDGRSGTLSWPSTRSLRSRRPSSHRPRRALLLPPRNEGRPMARAGLTPKIVTTHALDVLDAAGPAGLTLKAVAERAGVAPPSLYKHVRSLDDLRALMSMQILEQAADRIGSAVMGLSGDDALRAFLGAFRGYAVEYPHRHVLLESPASEGAHHEEVQAAAARLVDIAFATVRGYGLEGDELVHAVRALRSVVVGFVSLELGSGYLLPADLDASFAFLTDLLATGLARHAVPGPDAVPHS